MSSVINKESEPTLDQNPLLISLSEQFANKALEAYLAGDNEAFRWASGIHDEVQDSLHGRWSYENVVKRFNPLNEEQREFYGNVIFQPNPDEQLDPVRINAALYAMKGEGFNVAADVIMVNGEDGESKEERLVIRSGSDDRFDRATECALFIGVSGALKWEVSSAAVGRDADTVPSEVLNAANRVLKQVTNDSEFFNTFKEYYSGIRWSTDQQKLVRDLFEQSAEYDEGYLEESLTGSDVSNVVYKLDMDIPYDKRRDWYSSSPDEIFAQTPELDYRRLRDKQFKDTSEGQALHDAYRRVIGSKQAEEYENHSPNRPKNAGELIPKPVVPISRFPVIEALLVDGASFDGPKRKYDMGPQDETKIILDSDSTLAQWALVRNIKTRLPKERRHVFDGPSEFEHKRRAVSDFSRQFKSSYEEPVRSEQFKQHLLTIFEACIGQGTLAQDAIDEYNAEKASGRQYYSDTRRVKDIVNDVLSVTVASPHARNFIDRYFAYEETAEADNPVHLNQAELKLMLLDALTLVNPHSDPVIFKELGAKIFQDLAVADYIKYFAELKITADKIYYSPEVLRARQELSRFSIASSDDQMSEEHLRAKEALDSAIAPANELSTQYHQDLNKLLLIQLNNLVTSGLMTDATRETTQLFEGLVKRVNFGDRLHMKELPPAYTKLLDLCEGGELSDRQKSTIIWKFAESVQYSDAETQALLMPAILDIYRVALGPVQEIRMPSDDTSHLLSAVRHLAYNNRGLFKYATEEELLTLTQYKNSIATLADRIQSNARRETNHSQTLRNLSDVLRVTNSIEELYSEHLHLQEVKVKPNVYYPWVIEKLMPLWHGMNWEVGPGNMPNSEIKDLHKVLKNHVKNLLVIKEGEYPEDFDCFADGHLDSLLIECYNRMIVPHDIKYNGTVWKEGMSFMLNAVQAMPEPVLNQFKQTYPNSEFVNYVENTKKRWNK